MKKVLQKIKELVLKLIGKKKPKILTKTVNIGSATLIIQMKDGSVVQGYLKGSITENLEQKVQQFLVDLENKAIVTVDTQESLASFPTDAVKLVKTYNSNQFVEVTYEA